MKILQSSLFRAICAIAIGCLLIKYPDNTVTWMTVAIGVLFLLSGLISLIVYVNARKNVSEFKIIDAEGRVIAGEKPTFPIGAINQYMNLINARRYGKVGFGYWVFPSVVLLIGLYVIIRPMAPASMAMLILGWCSLLYGVTELINALKFHADKRKYKQAHEIPVAEEIIEEPASVEVIKEEEPSDNTQLSVPTSSDKL